MFYFNFAKEWSNNFDFITPLFVFEKSGFSWSFVVTWLATHTTLSLIIIDSNIMTVKTPLENDIYNYYQNIKQFFTSSHSGFDFEREVSNAGQRARSKLSNLTLEQFYELSTDVNDELLRRLDEDESNERKKFSILSSINKFHHKRNEARRKLTSLSQNRFDDLLQDILIEIERRKLNILSSQSGSKENHSKNDNTTTSTTTTTTTNSNNKNSIPKRLPQVPDNTEKFDNFQLDPKSPLISNNSIIATPNSFNKSSPFLADANNNGNFNNDIITTNSNAEDTNTIQQAIIIPKKASIDWSSSDESESDEHIDRKSNSNNNHLDETKIKGTSKNNNNLFSNLNKKNKFDSNLTHKIDSMGTTPIKKVLPNSCSNSTNDDTTVEENSHDKTKINDNNDDKSVDKQDDNVSLPQLEQVDSINKSDTTIVNEVDQSPKSNYFEQHEQQNYSKIIKENENLRKELDELKLKQQEKIESPMEKFHNNIKNFFDENGQIPINLVEKLQNPIYHLYDTLSHSDDLTNDKLGKELFTRVFQITQTLSQLFLLVDIPDFRDEVKLLRSSISQLITAVRYYCSFKDILPQLTVSTAISDLLFTFCNLLKVAKIKNLVVPETPRTIQNNEIVTKLSVKKRLTLNASVKPLRLAQKVETEKSRENLLNRDDSIDFNNNTAFNDPHNLNDTDIHLNKAPSRSILHDMLNKSSSALNNSSNENLT